MKRIITFIAILTAVAAAAAEPASRKAIEPLLGTAWSQGEPFNRLCPSIAGRRTLAGSTATALAQIMNYHRYPDRGAGMISYVNEYTYTQISVDLGSQPFAWADMADNYNGAYTESEAEATVWLTYACAAASRTQFGFKESTAGAADAATALLRHFGYNKGVVCLERRYYSAAEWEELLYRQLLDYGPVLVNERGWSFVCDGYSPDGRFHINWGRGGLNDGYYSLPELGAALQGFGCASSDSGQTIVANICRPRPGSHETVNMVYPEGFGFGSDAATPGGAVTVIGPIVNAGSHFICGYPGIKIVNTATGATQYAEHPYPTDFEVGSGLSSFALYLPAKLPSGRYDVTPVFRAESGSYTDCRVNTASPQAVRMDVSGSRISFTSGGGAAIRASNMALSGKLYPDTDFRLGYTICNDGPEEFYGDLYPALLAGERIVALAEPEPATVPAGKCVDFDYTGRFSEYPGGSAPAPGVYALGLAELSAGRYEILPGTVDVILEAEAEPVLKVESFGLEGDGTVEINSTIVVKATVSCISGYFSGELTVIISEAASGMEVCRRSHELSLEEGSSAELVFEMTVPGQTEGKRYVAGLYKGETMLTRRQLEFTLVSGIDAVRAAYAVPYPNPTSGVVHLGAAAPCEGSVIAADGRTAAGVKAGDTEVDLSGLPPGIYLIRLGADTFRIIRK